MSKQRSFRLADIVKQFGGELIGDAETRIERVAALGFAASGDITFVAQAKYLAQLRETRAAAVIVTPEARDATNLPRIVSHNPYAYFAKVSTLLNPPAAFEPGIHKSAVVARSAIVSELASIGPWVVIGKGAQIEDKAVIGAGCFIGDGACIGAYTHVQANVTIHHQCRLGRRCIVHSGAVIGCDGFGLAQEDGVWKKIPQMGRVLIGDDVEIGANTTIDRGALEDTIIEEGVKLDNQIQIAHNVFIGAHTAIAACAGIAGSARIGCHCALGGASMIYGHITIADHVTVSAGTLVMKSLPQAGTYTGVYPFSTHQRWLKTAAQLRQIDDLAQRVRALETALGKQGKEK